MMAHSIRGEVSRHRRGDRREVGHVAQHRLAAHRAAVANGFGALGRVDHERDVVALETVHDVRPTLANLVHVLRFDARTLEPVAGARGRNDLEAEIMKAPCELCCSRLVTLLHAHEHLAFVGKLGVRREQRLVEGVGEVVGDAHHLSRYILGGEERCDRCGLVQGI